MVEVKSRPDAELNGVTYKTKSGCGVIYVTINEYNGQPFEVFINLGKGGTCANVMLGAMGRDISHGLRGGVPLEEFSRTHFGSRCDSQISSVQNHGKPVFSCLDAIAKVFIEYLKKKNPLPPELIAPSTERFQPIIPPELPPKFYTEPGKIEVEKSPPTVARIGGRVCEVCGGPVVMESACEVCKVCGHSQRCGG
jgi:ribonucleoside-diphosphate reductase alpha chain